MTQTKITWTDPNTNEEGYNVYKSINPIDVKNLPEPVAELGPGITEYIDDISDNNIYDYVIGTVYNGEVNVDTISESKKILAGGPDIYIDFANNYAFLNGTTSLTSLVDDVHDDDNIVYDSYGNYKVYGTDVLTRNSLGVWNLPTSINVQVYGMPDENWSLQDCVLTSQTELAPDGTNAAVLITDDDGGAIVGARIQAGAPVADAVTAGNVIMSMAFKANGSNWVWLRSAAFDVADDAFFNLATGEVGTIDNGLDDAGIIPLGNGWYRCWIKFTTATALEGRTFFGPSTGDDEFPQTADGSLSTYAWGAQIENGTVVSPPIITEDSAVTRTGNDVKINVEDYAENGISGIIKYKLLGDANNSHSLQIGSDTIELPESSEFNTFVFAIGPSYKKIRSVDQADTSADTGYSFAAPGNFRLSEDQTAYQITEQLVLQFGQPDDDSFDRLYALAQEISITAPEIT